MKRTLAITAIQLILIVIFALAFWQALQYTIHHLPKWMVCLPDNDILSACIIIK